MGIWKKLDPDLRDMLTSKVFWSYVTGLLEGFLYNVSLGIWQAEEYAMEQTGFFYWQGQKMRYLTYTRIFGLVTLVYSIGIMLTGFGMDLYGIWHVN